MFKIKNFLMFQNQNLVSCLFVLAAIITLFIIPKAALATSPQEQSIFSTRLQALKAHGDGNLDLADTLYTQALSTAENAGSKMSIIEFLSRLTQVKIQNHKLGQTDQLVQAAIKLALSIKDTSDSDSNLMVWMNDMADAFLKKGENSKEENIKEYCSKHYLDIKLPLEDQYDPLLAGRANLLLTHLKCDGQYLEALPYEESFAAYVLRTKSDDRNVTAYALLGLANAYILAHKFDDAESTLNGWYSFKSKTAKDIGDEATLNFEHGQILREQKHLLEAKPFYQKAITLEEQYTGKPGVIVGMYKAIFGLLEEHLGNFKEASQLFQSSLYFFDHSSSTPEALLHSGKVICAEHLARITLKENNKDSAYSLELRAKKIRAENPQWAASKNHDPDNFYELTGQFPFPVEVIPTRVSLTYQ